MSTILIAAIVIAATTSVFWCFIFINKKNTRKRNKAFINTFNQAAAEQGLVFSGQEILKNKIIGVDGLHQKLLVLDFRDTNTIININLADVKDCTLKKEYDQVDFGSEKKPVIEHHLRSIAIQFSFKKRPELFLLPFYESNIHSIYEMADLERKTKDWVTLLSKFLLKEMEVRA